MLIDTSYFTGLLDVGLSPCPGTPTATNEAEAERTLTLRLTAAQRDGVWAETNSDPMFETYNTNVTLVVTDE